MEFLNANKIAIEHGTKVAWEHDKKVWDNVVEKAGRKDPDLDARKEFTVVDENELSAIEKKVQNGSWARSGKGGKVQGYGAGSESSQYREKGTPKGKTWTPPSWKGVGKTGKPMGSGKGNRSGKDASSKGKGKDKFQK